MLHFGSEIGVVLVVKRAAISLSEEVRYLDEKGLQLLTFASSTIY
jgi:hypothetical protein